MIRRLTIGYRYWHMQRHRFGWRQVGSYLAGDAVRMSMAEKIKAIESALADLCHENAGLKQALRDVRKSVTAQVALPL